MRTVLHMMAMLLPALVALPAGAGVVQTFDGRLEGDVSFADGRLDVGGKPAPWDAVVYALPQGRLRTVGGHGAVRLASGEVWQADILNMTAKRLTVRLALFGKREMDQAQVAAIDFAPGLGRVDGLQAGALYRSKGEPVPGTLLWIDDGRLAMDSSLGVLTLPRDNAVRYVFAVTAAKPPEAGTDEIGLVDGSILRGRAKPAAGGIRLEHPVLGSVAIEAGMIRFIARRAARVVDMAGVKPESVTAPGLLGAASPATTVEVRRADDSGAEAGSFLAAMTVQPKTAVRYRLDTLAPRGGQFVARLGAADGAKGLVHVRVTSAGKPLLERDVAPGAEMQAVKVDVAAGGTLDLEVDYGPQPMFPCGARFEDPILILAER